MVVCGVEVVDVVVFFDLLIKILMLDLLWLVDMDVVVGWVVDVI